MARPAQSHPPAIPPKPRAEFIATEGEVIRYIGLELARPLLRNYHQKNLMLGNLLCPADRRIQTFLDDYLKDVSSRPAAQIPANTFLLDRSGLARVMSLPLSGDTFASPYLHSYRVPQGILHNPKSDRRTTQGIFHVVEGGLPV